MKGMRQLKISKQITNRESQSLDKYLTEIAKVDLITADEEVQLAQRIRSGDQIALHKLAKANLRFVVSVAKQYQNSGLTLGDLINEGNVGLIKAAARFDETRGFKFISYAVWWIRQSIMQALAEQSRMVRLPLNRVSSLNKISRAAADLEQKFQREPSAEELAESLEMSTQEVQDNMQLTGRTISVDAPFIQGEDNNLLDTLENQTQQSPDQELLDSSLRQEISRSLSTLTDRESEVLISYFGLNGTKPLSLEEIGGKFSLTPERVRQIKEKAMRRLQHGQRSKVLKGYLG
jgi:RNA polymerase primary sigma factor